MSGRPNILLVMADQLAAAHLPAYGNAVVRAPRLTRLAGEGVVFESAYCASPLCSPSRFSLLAGRRPSSIGAYDNAAELPAGTPTIAHVLRAAGYGTTLAGKMHFVGPDQLHGFEERLTTDVYPSDFDWTPDWRLPPGERLEWYHNTTSLRSSRVTEAALQTDYDDEVCFRAVQKLRDLSLGEDPRPFFLTVSFTNPHDPWEQRQRYWDLYDERDIPLPAIPAIPRGEADPHSLRLRDMSLLDERPLDEDELRRARHGYYAAISYLDERVGELLDVLAATGLDSSTLVLFTADHGELLGERGLWYKMSFLEGSARVPLLVRGPGLRPARVSGAVSQLDIAPTLAALAGAPAAAAAFEGTSLGDALSGASGGPGEALGEYLAEGVTAPMVMLRRGRHKYVRCPGDPDLLYDLEADPSELANLSGKSELAATEHDLRLALAEKARTSPRRFAPRASGGGTSRRSGSACSRASASAISSRARWRAEPTFHGISSPSWMRPTSTSAARRPRARDPAARALQGAFPPPPSPPRRTSGPSFGPPSTCDRHLRWVERGRRPRRWRQAPCQLLRLQELLCLIRSFDGDLCARALSAWPWRAPRSRCLRPRSPTGSSTRPSTAPASTSAPPPRARSSTTSRTACRWSCRPTARSWPAAPAAGS